MRAVRYFSPEERRYLQKNLQCIECGNTTAFSIDLKLKHQVSIEDDSTILIHSSKSTEKVFHSITQNIHMIVDNDQQVVQCANCQCPTVDIQERLIDWCWQTGCPGCFCCGHYLEKAYVIETCTDCLKENNGKIEEEECSYNCAYFDGGLGEVRTHHKIDFATLKRDLGY